jgi:hypothetical protein
MTTDPEIIATVPDTTGAVLVKVWRGGRCMRLPVIAWNVYRFGAHPVTLCPFGHVHDASEGGEVLELPEAYGPDRWVVENGRYDSLGAAVESVRSSAEEQHRIGLTRLASRFSRR